MARVTVVGAGVVGLTCAVRLLEDGHRVDVLARDLPLETTSAVAAAVWYPYLAFPRERVLGLVDGVVRRVRRPGGGRGHRGDDARRHRGLPHSRRRTRGGARAVSSLDKVAPPPGYADAWTFLAPVVEMPVYLAWLAARVRGAGRHDHPPQPLGPARSGPDVVVNASALGSRLLAEDPTVTPVRGQVVLVEQVGAGAVVAAVHGSGDVRHPALARHRRGRHRGARRLEPDAVTRDRGGHPRPGRAGWCPSSPSAAVLRHRVGLRPARPSVRVERVGDVVHCYGHGGAGVTLSWGTADEVATLSSASAG